jgi:hypothetical protein
MAEVPDHLVPSDGLTNSKLRFAGFDLLDGGEQIVRFELFSEQRAFIATFPVRVGRSESGNVDTVIADAHARMRSNLRQWLYEVDVMEQFYRKQAQRT